MTLDAETRETLAKRCAWARHQYRMSEAAEQFRRTHAEERHARMRAHIDTLLTQLDSAGRNRVADLEETYRDKEARERERPAVTAPLALPSASPSLPPPFGLFEHVIDMFTSDVHMVRREGVIRALGWTREGGDYMDIVWASGDVERLWAPYNVRRVRPEERPVEDAGGHDG